MGNDTNEAACARTGRCCTQLMPHHTLDYVAQMRKLGYTDNHSLEFVDGWERAAQFAIQRRKVCFTCPFLADGNVCMLQDRKPGICSGSLSPDRLNHPTFSEQFFSASCGFLRGAPKHLVDAVKHNDAVKVLHQALMDGNPDMSPMDALRAAYKELEVPAKPSRSGSLRRELAVFNATRRRRKFSHRRARKISRRRSRKLIRRQRKWGEAFYERNDANIARRQLRKKPGGYKARHRQRLDDVTNNRSRHRYKVYAQREGYTTWVKFGRRPESVKWHITNQRWTHEYEASEVDAMMQQFKRESKR